MPRSHPAEKEYADDSFSVWNGERYYPMSPEEARSTPFFCSLHWRPHRHIHRSDGDIIGCEECVKNGHLEETTPV